MLNKYKKAVIKMSFEGKGYSESSATVKLKDGKLLEELKREYERHGKLVIERIKDNEIYLTTAKTLKYQYVDDKLYKIKNLLMDYINGSNS